MSTETSPGAYSAAIRIWLEAGDRVIQLAQLDADWVIPQAPTELPPCEADIVLEVDGRAVRRRVSLPDGIFLNSKFVKVVTIQGIKAATV